MKVRGSRSVGGGSLPRNSAVGGSRKHDVGEHTTKPGSRGACLAAGLRKLLFYSGALLLSGQGRRLDGLRRLLLRRWNLHDLEILHGLREQLGKPDGTGGSHGDTRVNR